MGRVEGRSQCVMTQHRIPDVEVPNVAQPFGRLQLHCDIQQRWKLSAQKTLPSIWRHRKGGLEIVQAKSHGSISQPPFSPFSLLPVFLLMTQYYSLPQPLSNSKIWIQLFLPAWVTWTTRKSVQIWMSYTVIWAEIDFLQALASQKRRADSWSPCSTS